MEGNLFLSGSTGQSWSVVSDIASETPEAGTSGRVWARKVEPDTGFFRTVKSSAICLSYPVRRFLADMCIEIIRACTVGALIGLKIGNGVTAEICSSCGVTEEKTEAIQLCAAVTTGVFFGSLSLLSVAIPWGIAVASYNLLSGASVKTAIKGDIDTVSNGVCGEIIEQGVRRGLDGGDINTHRESRFENKVTNDDVNYEVYEPDYG